MDTEPAKYVNARRGPQEMAAPFSRAATPQWRIWLAPFGRDPSGLEKNRPSAVLRTLDVGWFPRRASVLYLDGFFPSQRGLAAAVNITLLEY